MIKKIFYNLDDFSDCGLSHNAAIRAARAANKKVEPINKAIEEAVEVTSVCPQGLKHGNIWSQYSKDATRKALLLNIEPIKQESAADIAKEYIKEMNDPDSEGSSSEMLCRYGDRFQVALERESK